MNHKEMTAHIRRRLKASGIKAKCSLYDSCGYHWIRVCTPTFGSRFTDGQQKEINLIAKVNGLTKAQGLEIDIERATISTQVNYLFTQK